VSAVQHDLPASGASRAGRMFVNSTEGRPKPFALAWYW
jgi:hypothetical protein